MTGTDNIKIASLNVRGIQNENKRKEIFIYLKSKRLDILCLQETHSQQDDIIQWNRQWGNNCFYSHGDSQSRGVMILTKPHIKVDLVYKDEEGRLLLVKVSKQNESFLLVNVYALNKDDPDYFSNMFNQVGKVQMYNIIIIGDFNLVLNETIDWKNGSQYHPKAHKLLTECIDELDLTDIW